MTYEDACTVKTRYLKHRYCRKICVRAPTTLKSEGEVTSLSGADKREVRDNREKW